VDDLKRRRVFHDSDSSVTALLAGSTGFLAGKTGFFAGKLVRLNCLC
jgi:hypothetical protein